MARIAGNSGSYELSLVDKDGRAAGVSIKLPSVTTILGALPKHGLDWWGYKIGLQAALHLVGTRGLDDPDDLEDVYTAAKASPYTPQKALKTAGGRGSSVHDEAEALLKGTKTRAQVAKLTDGYVDALLKWWDGFVESGAEIIAVEVPIFSLKHRYSGTFDYLLLMPDGTYVLGDYKTSKAIYESHLIQTAAYAEAACELGLIPPGAKVRKEVVRLGADGEVEVRESTNTIEDFLTVKAVWDLLNPPKTKRGKR